ncbi:ankyrin repeat and SOCS box protein 15 isoform X9 [Canis lupus dingo]|uniref:ankyrin repeat and SOCS box protein 15 isoform X9 n=1 Tax=Canis lupus dingo TaxID=286419 RepID=UPI0015F188A4|nr:ankyrin repeat and SOCS box protein 15 isoform X9 [Canis lupus dingo]XP_038542209.1 ankyrin repeat and SOCS box protein 15 isoform X5 [Canis lupus familiaris]
MNTSLKNCSSLRKLPLSKLYPVMDTNDDPDDDHLTSYDIQLSIQESIEASKSVFYSERFAPLSDQNRKLVEAIKQGHILELQEYVKYKYALDEADEKGWFPLHEAVVQPIQQILEIVLDASYQTLWEFKTSDGETPLTLAVKAGLVENVRTLLEKGVWPNTKNDKGETPLLIGGDVFALADDGASVLFEAAGGGNPDCISLLLEYGGSGNVPNRAGHLPIHRAAYEGHYLALKYLIPVTSKNAIQKSGLTPIHSAADGQNVQCLELLIENGFDVNTLLADHISESYDDERKTALYFAVSNNDIQCTEVLLAAGADPNLDPLNCLLVAVRANNHEIVRLLLSHGANVNCYFMHVNDTRFPSAIQYALNDEVMLRLLLNNGYRVEMCFDCMHGNIFGNSFVWSEIEEEVLPGWTSCVIKDNPFCEFITVPWMKHLVGSVIRVLIDYMDYIPLCAKLKSALEVQREWPEIRQILENPCSLKHLCRLKIRRLMGLQRLCQPASMEKLHLPPTIQRYILFKEYDLYGQELNLPFPHRQIEDNLNKKGTHEMSKNAIMKYKHFCVQLGLFIGWRPNSGDD